MNPKFQDKICGVFFISKRKKVPTRLAPEKSGKGLRHFSMKVCEKVQQKGITSYNEVSLNIKMHLCVLLFCIFFYFHYCKFLCSDLQVADELVQEFSEASMKNPIQHPDQVHTYNIL